MGWGVAGRWQGGGAMREAAHPMTDPPAPPHPSKGAQGATGQGEPPQARPHIRGRAQ